MKVDGLVTRAYSNQTVARLFTELSCDTSLQPSRVTALTLPDPKKIATPRKVLTLHHDPDHLLAMICDEPGSSQNVFTDIMQTQTGRAARGYF